MKGHSLFSMPHIIYDVRTSFVRLVFMKLMVKSVPNCLDFNEKTLFCKT